MSSWPLTKEPEVPDTAPDTYIIKVTTDGGAILRRWEWQIFPPDSRKLSYNDQIAHGNCFTAARARRKAEKVAMEAATGVGAGVIRYNATTQARILDLEDRVKALEDNH